MTIYQNKVMKISEEQKMKAWVAFAAGALAGIATLEAGNMEDECDVVAEYADQMLENFENTFANDDE